MTNIAQKIKCPSCGTEIDVNALVYHPLNEQVQKEYKAKLAELEKQKETLAESIQERVKKQAATEISILIY